MSESTTGSITNWIGGIKEGDDEAARKIWERYFDKLCRIARQKLGGTPRREADEEDVALSVFEIVYRGAAQGRFPALSDRQDLWRLLAAITAQKAVDQKRRRGRQKRGGGKVRGESVFVGRMDKDSRIAFEHMIADDPTPELIAIMSEEYEHLLGLLRDETLRRIACWRMEGYTNEEIADTLGVSLRTVERKLNLIREHWSKEIAD